MKARFKKRCANCIVAKEKSGCLFGCNKEERVLRELEVLVREINARRETAIEEQLRQCPEAFKAGELLERMFECTRDSDVMESCLPPAVSIIPPFG